jgi:plasmid stabilization system protein ParE
MSHRVEISRQAERDLLQIQSWLQDRSPQGAAAWLDSWQEILKRIADNPELFSVAPENPDHPDEIRQATFKTRRGRRYRTLFVVRGDVVAILHVRGPGQKFIP